MSDDLENLIYKSVERWAAARYTERHALVTSYDPDKYLAKVTFQPEGQESGWLPIETGHIGNGWGFMIGLAAGDGKSTGDQVVVRYQEGDIESGKIVQRVHSDQDKPPGPIQSGEILFRHEGGANIKFDKSNNLTLTGAGKSSTLHATDGSITHTDSAGGVIYQAGGLVHLASKSASLAVITSGGASTKIFGII